jgi:hypothetical protein
MILADLTFFWGVRTSKLRDHLPSALRLQVRPAFFAEADRAAAERAARACPPRLPRFCAWPLSIFWPRREPRGWLPPPVMLLTVAQANAETLEPQQLSSFSILRDDAASV